VSSVERYQSPRRREVIYHFKRPYRRLGCIGLFGVPMKIYCEVLFKEAALSEKFGKCAEYLWVEIDIPCVVPVGSTLDLPTPKEWRPITGEMSAEITSWDITGGVLSCTAEPYGFTCDPEGIAELLLIGYSGDEPREIGDAYESVFR
jgi:hypothetical protein